MCQPPDDWIPAAAAHFRQGDLKALERLHNHFSESLWRSLVRLVGDHEEARQLVQETIIAAWKSRSDLKEPAKFKSWLFRIASNKGMDYHRRTKLPTVPWDQVSYLVADRWEPESGQMESREECPMIEGPENIFVDNDLLNRALAKLPEHNRRAFLLREVEGFSTEEIAQIMGISRSCVDSYVSVGRKRLREILQENPDWPPTKGGVKV